MTEFNTYTAETAPEGSKEILKGVEAEYGFIPELMKVLAGSPELLATYIQAHTQFVSTSFTAEEKTVVWQTINVIHECVYCVPAHTAIAKSMNVDDAITDALRNETALGDAKLESLRDFVTAVVVKRGHVSGEDLEAFYGAGYSEQNVLEIITGLAQKVITNYTNHIAKTTSDPQFAAFAWSKAEKVAAE
ncbi:carboxymuconolactone decarboxylase family protein [Epibacterium sp. SM1979]|uniref:Carboxymuconolactone decarboxylase family protein n=1 Tax=Tritonibacter litoralis TaxID=2662264 RepID=A0A843YIE3_9RHOB|nr:carboxymuconolactone decarboxylase family protein [Tritonibacter litoralis]MQQ08993.1 carboxymuconolactone decarboxylase family protein [Tritonibacter litoralis]